MSSKKSYNRFFIILQEDQKGYGIDSNKTPSGYAKLEIKNDKTKSTFYVQSLKKQKGPYYMILIVQGKSGKELINLGQINIDESGKADVSNEYNTNNVANTNIGMEKVQGAAICRISSEKISPVMVGFTGGEEMKNWHSCPMAKSDNKPVKNVKESPIISQVKEEKKQVKEEPNLSNHNDKKIKEEPKQIKEIPKEHKQEEKHIKENKCEGKMEAVPYNENNKAIKGEIKHSEKEDEKEKPQVDPCECSEDIDEIPCKSCGENEDSRDVEGNIDSQIRQEYKTNDKSETFEEYEKEIERLKEYRKKHSKKYDQWDNDEKKNESNKCEEEDKDYPVGPMGNFFKEAIKGLEKIGENENIKNCFWYKAHVGKLEDMYCVYDYNKYSVVYYPMICYYPYISRHKEFMVGYKCDDEGQLKYIIYAISGTKNLVDQPYEGKTGFVTFMPEGRNVENGQWLMYYDVKANTVVVPVKR